MYTYNITVLKRIEKKIHSNTCFSLFYLFFQKLFTRYKIFNYFPINAPLWRSERGRLYKIFRIRVGVNWRGAFKREWAFNRVNTVCALGEKAFSRCPFIESFKTEMCLLHKVYKPYFEMVVHFRVIMMHSLMGSLLNHCYKDVRSKGAVGN